MPYKIEVRPLAAIEIIEAYDWYELQREGLGLEFLDSLEDFYKSLESHPQHYSYYQEPVRQGNLKRFPYITVFEIIEDTVVVFSVFMTSRNDLDKKK
ncbi:MAG TPA: type II toxin-antitoxin system RelE/ParE family toxin [Flavitalea sp.]|nr:type II toxin-antitoxin system RelE/ParE family toxin [Flavitalea sp.]